MAKSQESTEELYMGELRGEAANDYANCEAQGVCKPILQVI